MITFSLYSYMLCFYMLATIKLFTLDKMFFEKKKKKYIHKYDIFPILVKKWFSLLICLAYTVQVTQAYMTIVRIIVLYTWSLISSQIPPCSHTKVLIVLAIFSQLHHLCVLLLTGYYSSKWTCPWLLDWFHKLRSVVMLNRHFL